VAANQDSNGLGMTVRHMSNPAVWYSAYQSLGSLAAGQYILGPILNLYFIDSWYRCREPKVHYIDLEFTLAMRMAPLNPIQSRTFRKQYLHPLDDSDIPLRPVAFAVLHEEHYFTAVFDYSRDTAFVLGRSRSSEGAENDDFNDWTHWSGPELWKNAASLFGWRTVSSSSVTVEVENWVQNATDCGATLCDVLGNFIQFGLSLDASGSLRLPAIRCGHVVRFALYEFTTAQCRISFQNYSLHPESGKPSEWTPEDISDVDVAELKGLTPPRHQKIREALRQSMITCVSCRREVPTTPGYSNASRANVDFPSNNKQLLARAVKAHPDLKKSRRKAQQGRSDREGSYSSEGENEGEDGDVEDEESDHHPPRHWKVAAKLPSASGRFPRPAALYPLPPFTGRRWWRTVDGFDDFLNGPTKETMAPLPDTICQGFTFGSRIQRFLSRGSWEMHRDYGWRTLSNFAQMFYASPPYMVSHHILPIGLPLSGQPLQTPLVEDPPLDVCTLGAREMLEKAGEEGSPQSHSVFVCGKVGQQYIVVDLERDARRLPLEDVDIGVDIDSFNWVGSHLLTKKCIKIHTGPYIGQTPPIRKNNHAYVDLLVPQTEADRASGGRGEWDTVRLPLSGIPHTYLATFGEGSGCTSVIALFPRMTHRSEYNGRRVSFLPNELGCLFFSEIVLPALKPVVDPKELPYIDFTFEELRQKASTKGKRDGDPTKLKQLPFSPAEFDQVQVLMRQKIASDPDRYGRFGSMILLVEGKGVKGWTGRKQSGYQTALDALRTEFDCLDWDYLLDRKNGELTLDVGISFNPVCKEPVVGLWKLANVEASFGAAGMNKGTLHTACTLGHYGGLQAEMMVERSRRTHIVFRSTYNLAYEVTRRNDNQACLIEDKDAFEVNHNYVAEWKRLYNSYSGGALRRSYGNRDECRVGGQAVGEALGVAVEAVSASLCQRITWFLTKHTSEKAVKYLESDPILWLPSSLWFGFLSRRVFELQKTQMTLQRQQHRRPNYGVLTSIVTHMLRCVSSTPIVYEAHLRESLLALNYQPTIDRFGMFFLHDLELEKVKCLPEVQAKDDANVLRTMGSTAHRKQKITNKAMNQHPGGPLTEEFPLGPSPTWREICDALRDDPWKLLREWSWENDWDHSLSASRIFVKFTRQFWSALRQDWLQRPLVLPQSLKEAMGCWSLETVLSNVLRCHFMPCSAGLLGAVPGKRPKSFAERWEVFFPLDRTLHKDSVWRVFFEKGYIKEYLETAVGDMLLLRQSLSQLLGQVQCLPTSTNCTPKSPGILWQKVASGIGFLANPEHYRIRSVGAQSGARKARTRDPPATGTQAHIEMAIARVDGLDEGGARRLRVATLLAKKADAAAQKKARRAKNSHVPPRKPRPSDPGSSSQDSGLIVSRRISKWLKGKGALTQKKRAYSPSTSSSSSS